MFEKITEHAMLLLSVAGIIIFFTYSLSSSEEESATEKVKVDYYESYEMFEGTYLPNKMDNKTKVVLGRFYEEQRLVRDEFGQLTAELKPPELTNLKDINFLKSQVQTITALKKAEQENFIKNKLLRDSYLKEFRQIHQEKKDPSAKVIADTLAGYDGEELHDAAWEYFTALIEYYQFFANHHGEFSIEMDGVQFDRQKLYQQYIPLADRVAWSDEAYQMALAKFSSRMRGSVEQ